MANYDFSKDTIFQFAKFCLVGVFNTIVGLGLIFLFKYYFSYSDVLSNMLGYVVGVCVSYVLNGIFTFDEKRLDLWGLGRFFVVFVVAYSVNLAVTLCAIDYFSVNSYYAHVVGIVPYTMVSFIGGKLFVYRGGYA